MRNVELLQYKCLTCLLYTHLDTQTGRLSDFAAEKLISLIRIKHKSIDQLSDFIK